MQVLTLVNLPGPAVSIACGHRHTLINVSGHSVFAFGMNSHSQLGVQSAFWSSSLPRPATRPFGAFPRSLAAGASFSVFADGKDELFACGKFVVFFVCCCAGVACILAVYIF